MRLFEGQLGQNNNKGCFRDFFFVFVLNFNAIFRPCKAEVDMMLVFHHHSIMLTTMRTFCCVQQPPGF